MTTLKERAQELLDARMAALDILETAYTHAETLRRDLKAADAAVATAWTGATEAGWLPAELRKLGISQPATRRGGRPKRAPGTPSSRHDKTSPQ